MTRYCQTSFVIQLCLAGASLGAMVVLLLTCYHPGDLLPMVDFDLMVPSSFRPFANNGSRLGVHTAWNLQSVKVENHITAPFNTTVPISRLNELAAIFKIDQNQTVIHTVEAICKVTQTIANTGAGCAIATFVALVLSITAISMKHLPRNVFHSSWMHMCSCALTRISALINLIVSATIIFTAALFGNELLLHVKTILPYFIHKLQYICLTHTADECTILTVPREGIYAIVVAIASLTITSIVSLAVISASHYKPIPLYVAAFDSYQRLPDNVA